MSNSRTAAAMSMAMLAGLASTDTGPRDGYSGRVSTGHAANPRKKAKRKAQKEARRRNRK